MLRLHRPLADCPLLADARQQGHEGELKLDRRGIPRKVMQQTLTAVYTADDGQRGMLRVDVVDGSWMGLGAISAKWLARGTQLSFCAPGTPMMTRTGVVVRTSELDGQHKLGIRLDAKRLG